MEQHDGKENNDTELIYVNIHGMKVDVNEKFVIVENNDHVVESIESFKNALLDTIKQLKDIITFLKDDIEEKNLFIRTLLLRDANEDNHFHLLRRSSSNQSINDVETTSNNSSITINSEISQTMSAITQEDNQSKPSDNNNDSVVSGNSQRISMSYEDQLNTYRSINHTLFMNIKDCTKHNESISNSFSSVIGNNCKINRGIGNVLKPFNTNHEEFHHEKSTGKVNVNVKKWPKRTILIASDSTFNQLDEKKLSKHNNIKVRAFSGATVEDMHYYLHPLLAKEPDFILLHVGTNNSTDDDADEIVQKILHLKSWIEEKLPNCEVILSEPINRFDIPKATRTVKEVIGKLNKLNFLIMDNSNIEREQIGKKGLHMNDHGTRRVAMNIISLIRGL